MGLCSRSSFPRLMASLGLPLGFEFPCAVLGACLTTLVLCIAQCFVVLAALFWLDECGFEVGMWAFVCLAIPSLPSVPLYSLSLDIVHGSLHSRKLAWKQ